MFFFEESDAIQVVFHHVLLFGGFPNLVVVGRDAGDVVQDLSSLVGRHLGQTGHVSLKHDVVAVGPCIGRSQQSVKHLLRAVLAVEFVGRDGVV